MLSATQWFTSVFDAFSALKTWNDDDEKICFSSHHLKDKKNTVHCFELGIKSQMYDVLKIIQSIAPILSDLYYALDLRRRQKLAE